MIGNISCNIVALRARVIPGCLDNPNIYYLREVTFVVKTNYQLDSRDVTYPIYYIRYGLY